MARANRMSPAAREIAAVPQGARQKLARIISELKGNFAERDSVIEALFALFLCRQNALLLGAPGTAKSALVEACATAFGVGDRFFRYLLTTFTTDAELFGPWSIQGIKEDRYRRQKQGYLPTAHVAFLDECFKANSAVLNSLLWLLNEREMFDDGKRISVPIQMVIGASNELPEGPQLAAMYDRMVARYWIDPVTAQASRLRIMLGEASGAPANVALTPTETDELRAGVAAVTRPRPMAELLTTILDVLAKDHGISVTDRRRKAIWNALPAFAFVAGDDEVSDDTILATAPDMLWDEPKQRPTVYNCVAKLANPNAAKAQEIMDAVDEAMRALPPRPEASNPAYTQAVMGAREVVKKASQKLLALDPKRRNGRVKAAAARMAEHLYAVTGEVAYCVGFKNFDASAMKNLGSAGLHTALSEYGTMADGETEE